MRSRLDRAERAIEQERAANRDLQAALQACRQARLLHVHSANVTVTPTKHTFLLHTASPSTSYGSFKELLLLVLPADLRDYKVASADTELQERFGLQSGAAQEDASAGKMAAVVAALRRDLAEASTALAAQKASNKGLQIRVAELLKGSSDAAALRTLNLQLKQERDALLASKHQWTTNETCMPHPQLVL